MTLNWNTLYQDQGALPRALFFGEGASLLFRYGLNEQLQRCLFFQVPNIRQKQPIAPVVLANVGLDERKYEGSLTFVLYLINEDYRFQFDDLIMDIVNETKNIAENDLETAFISICNKWFEFFQPGYTDLSPSELKGIFAELSFLKLLLNHSNLPYNDILESWKGPFGKGHDFELGNKHFEIKGIDQFKDLVHISSEYQLDYLNGQCLTLVVSRFSNQRPGESITDLISDLTEVLRSHSGIKMLLFWTRLRKAGINISNLSLYSSTCFFISETEYYNASSPDFPSIIRTNLPECVQRVHYELAFEGIKPYKIIDLQL